MNHLYTLNMLCKDLILTSLCVFLVAGCGGSSESADTTVEVDDTSSTAADDSDAEGDTDTEVTTDTAVLTSWVLNASSELTQYIDGGTTLVNVVSVDQVIEDGIDYALIVSPGVPNYTIIATNGLIEWLNLRPRAEVDFDTGSTTLSTGDEVGFGADIGYSFAECPDGEGQGYWPSAGPGCTSGDANREGYFPLIPTAADNPEDTSPLTIGYAVNGVSFYNWFDGMSYNQEGVWNHLASIAELYDVDLCGGHPAPTTYHHHHYSDCWADAAGEDFTGHSEVYGYAADGYPLYGPLEDTDLLAKSCWIKRDYDVGPEEEGYGCVGFGGAIAGERSCTLIDPYDPSLGVESSSAGPTTSETILSGSQNEFSSASGFYFQDYYYDSDCTASGSEYLDEHNGHTDDERGYHYHLTVETMPTGDYVPVQATFPFTLGPQFAGEILDNSVVERGAGQ